MRIKSERVRIRGPWDSGRMFHIGGSRYSPAVFLREGGGEEGGGIYSTMESSDDALSESERPYLRIFPGVKNKI